MIQVLELIKKTPTIPIIDDNQLINPIRIFQIVDPVSLKPLFVWPQLHSFIDMIQSLAKEIVLKEFKNPTVGSSTTTADDVSCTRHFYANSKIELFITKKVYDFQRILIPYGNILFESFQVTPIPIITTTATSFLGRQQTGMYMNNFALFFNVKKLLKSDNEKEEVDRKLPLTFQHEHVVNNFALKEKGEERRREGSSRGKNISCQTTSHNFNTSATTVASVISPSSHLRKFKIQHPPQELAIKQQSFTSSSIEKKRRNVFHGSVAITSTSPEGTKVCTRCHTSNSPEWRRGPDGHKT